MSKTPMGNYGVPYMMMRDWNMSQREAGDGREYVYRADLPVPNTEPGVIVAPGMVVRVIYTFHNWNFVDGLTLHYVLVEATGMYTHVSPSDLTPVDDDWCAELHEFGSCIHSDHMSKR